MPKEIKLSEEEITEFKSCAGAYYEGLLEEKALREQLATNTRSVLTSLENYRRLWLNFRQKYGLQEKKNYYLDPETLTIKEGNVPEGTDYVAFIKGAKTDAR